MRGWSKVVALAAFAAGATAPADAQSACDRACLTGYIDAYFAALFANDAARLRQAARARITDNGAEKKLADTFWAGAEATVYRFDIVNTDRGDTGTQTVIRNADGSKTMHMVRLKVLNGAITEIETIRANEGEADRLWGPDQLTAVSPDLPNRFASPSATRTTTSSAPPKAIGARSRPTARRSIARLACYPTRAATRTACKRRGSSATASINRRNAASTKGGS